MYVLRSEAQEKYKQKQTDHKLFQNNQFQEQAQTFILTVLHYFLTSPSTVVQSLLYTNKITLTRENLDPGYYFIS